MVGRQSKFLIWINYRVRVTIQDSRMLIGTFLAFDKHMNLVLTDTEEYTKIKAKKQGEVDREKKRSLGLVLLRGENIVSISAESPPSQNTKRLSEIPNTGGRGTTQPLGRGMPVAPGGMPQAPSGLSGPGRGVGVPSMMTMMPTIGRGMTPINPPMQRMPMSNMGMGMNMPPQNLPPQNMPNKIPMGGMMPGNIPMGGMIRPPMMNPMMVRPPQGGNLGLNLMPNQLPQNNLNLQNQNQ